MSQKITKTNGKATGSARSGAHGSSTGRSAANASKKPARSSSGKAAKAKEPDTAPKRRAQSPAEESEVKEKRILTKEEQSVRNEIILTVTALISVLMILAFFGLGGPVGSFVNQLLFGAFGALGYVFPILLFFFTAFYLSNHGNKVASRKMLAGVAFIILLASLLQMIFGLPEGLSVLDYYKYCAEHKNGGGLIGALIALPFNTAFGKPATIIIIVAFMIIFLMILTGKALFALITKKSKESLKHAQELHKERQRAFDEMEDEEIERELRSRRILPFVDLKKFEDDKNDDENTKDSPEEDELISFVDKLKRRGGADSTFEPVKASDKEKAGNAADAFPSYTITGAREEQGPSPADMIEVTPKRPAKAVLATEQPEPIESVPKHKHPDEKTKADPAINEQTAAQIDASLANTAENEKKYVFPPISLLGDSNGKNGGVSKKEIEKNAELLTNTLESFGVHVKLLNVSCGPTVTRYELAPDQGVKVSSITKLENDIKLNLAASDIRIEAPIPGKAAVGIEVPNKENSTVSIRELIESSEFKKQAKGITFAVGKDIGGNCIVTDISKMPHLLIAGATGSGKSVCINTLVMSILYKYDPEEIRLIMIDPKMVELGIYNGIPHLLIPVVTDPKKAAASLNWAVLEMTNRYEKFAEAHVRDLAGYNAYIEAEKKKPENKEDLAENPHKYKKMPKIVIIVDELADLMMVAPKEVEDAIIRLSQLARAAGMHLVIATQRPSVNVITGLIKANMPSRIALAVTSNVDSRTILDQGGAEKLIGKGDMLFSPMNLPKPIRVQGAFVSDGDVEKVVDFIKDNNPADSDDSSGKEIDKKIDSISISGGKSNAPADVQDPAAGQDTDEYLIDAGRMIIEKQKASIGMLQRVYRIGFNRAARIVDRLSELGVLGPENGTKSREILMTKEEFDEFAENNLR